MRRGTTPVNVFKVDLDLTEATAIYITYKQKDVVLEKTLGDIQFEGTGVLRVQLSQQETLRFNTSEKISVQIRAVLADGNRVASNIITTNVQGILKDGEI